MIHGLDLALLCVAVAICTATFAVVCNGIFTGWDVRVLNWFSNATQSPKWFTVWILILLAWIPVRALLVEHSLWFRGDFDLVVMTVLWSVIPFMVENAMKYTAAQQMTQLARQSERIEKQNQHIADLTLAIRAELGHSKERDEITHVLVERLLSILEEETVA